LAEIRFRGIGTVKPFLPLLREMAGVFAAGTIPGRCNQSDRVREYWEVQYAGCAMALPPEQRRNHV
jgi:hypothetical protein